MMQQQMQSPLLAAQGQIILDQLATQSPQIQTPIIRLNPSVTVVTGGGTRGESTAYTFTQIVPATVWVIVHNLGGFPSVTITDVLGNVILGQVQYINSNQINLTFSQPVSGAAYLNL